MIKEENVKFKERRELKAHRWWPSGQRAGVVVPRTRVRVPPIRADNFRPSPSVGGSPVCWPGLPSTLNSAILFKWSTAGQRQPGKSHTQEWLPALAQPPTGPARHTSGARKNSAGEHHHGQVWNPNKR